MTVLVLGDQLTRTVGPVADGDDVLLIESEAAGHRLPYHPHKLTAVYAAMRQFRDDPSTATRSTRGRSLALQRCTDTSIEWTTKN